MTAFVDTNLLVRHLTNDPPDMAKRATAFLAEAAGVTEIVSFDRSISRVASIDRIDP